MTSPSNANMAMISGAIRKKGGTWGLIDDAGHTPTGISGVTDRGNYLEVFYDFVAEQVSSLIVTADETYAVQGYSFGASAGFSSAKVYAFKAPLGNVGGYVACSRGKWVPSTGNITSVTPYGGHGLRIEHPAVDPSDELHLSITGRGSGGYIYRCEGAGVDYTNVGIYHLDGSPVSGAESDMKFFVTRAAGGGGRVKPSDMPEGWSNIWLHGVMHI